MNSGKYQSDGISLKGLFLVPMFTAEVVLLGMMCLTCIFATITKSWPRFCFSHASIFFLNIEMFVSLAIMDIAAVLVWIVFENNNWVHYAIIYLTHGILMFFVGMFYIYSVMQGCPDDEGLYPQKSVRKVEYFDIKEIIIQMSILLIGMGYLGLAIYIIVVKDRFSKPRKDRHRYFQKIDKTAANEEKAGEKNADRNEENEVQGDMKASDPV